MLQPPPPPADGRDQREACPGEASPTQRAISIVANSLALLFGLLALAAVIVPPVVAMGHEGIGYFLVLAPVCSLLAFVFFLGARDHDKKGRAGGSVAALRFLGLIAAVCAVAWIAFCMLLGGR